MNQQAKNQQPRAKQERTSEFRRKGPFPNQKELDLQLLSACIMGKTALAKDALEKGANPNAMDPEGKTVLMIVAMENFHEIGRLLIDSGADATIKNSGGLSALCFANTFSSKDMRKMLEAELGTSF
jgi:ankyrin repeat protein